MPLGQNSWGGVASFADYSGCTDYHNPRRNVRAAVKILQRPNARITEWQSHHSIAEPGECFRA
jgi:hypothetical protein